MCLCILPCTTLPFDQSSHLLSIGLWPDGVLCLLQTAFAQQKYQSIQSLYNSICDLYSAGKETDFDIAELLAIPDRVYLVSQLSRGLDKLVDSGELDKYSPPAGQDNGRVRVSKLTAVVAVSGVPLTSPEPEEVVTHPEPLSKPRPKTWNEIRADAECKKKTSSACIIL